MARETEVETSTPDFFAGLSDSLGNGFKKAGENLQATFTKENADVNSNLISFSLTEKLIE